MITCAALEGFRAQACSSWLDLQKLMLFFPQADAADMAIRQNVTNDFRDGRIDSLDRTVTPGPMKPFAVKLVEGRRTSGSAKVASIV